MVINNQSDKRLVIEIKWKETDELRRSVINPRGDLITRDGEKIERITIYNHGDMS